MDLKKVDEALKLAEELQERKEVNRIDHYEPYPYQTEFHKAQDLFGTRAKQRLLMAANKVGKTFSGAAELAIHLTGKYPDWWTGHKFYKPIRAWAAGNTSGNTRDIVQAELLGEPGDPEDYGKGALPKDSIVSTDRAPGIPNALSAVVVKHISGKNSKLFFKSYEQGKEQWMGSAVDCVWLDEEPPQPIYSQALRATLKSAGLVWMTFTPESGMTATVSAFMNDLKKSQNLYHATWDDAPHLTDDAKEEILSALPPHERDMRSKGIPVLGSGLVFPIDEESITEEAFAIPEHWSKICGIDFGWDHPFAAVWIAHDRDTDTIHVYDTYRVSATTPVVHADAIKKRGEWIPISWPHDGMQHEKGSGEPLAKQYRRLGCNMLGTHFSNPDGGNAVEPGVLDIFMRMQSGRFKVFNHLSDWFSEMRMYHRKDGKIIKERDDLMSATRYAAMSLRYAGTLNWEPRIETAVGTADQDYVYFS